MTIAVTGFPARIAPRWRLWLALGLGTLLLVRLIALKLNRTDLFFDEAQYWSWSLEPAFGYFSKPPLIAWVIGLSTSLCGSSEFCIRLPAPILHTLTAAALYLLGARLYGVAVGFWSALAFATLPGISLSAGIISTDVPLLLFWALALLGFVALIDTRAWWPALLIGASLGLGLNAKYAMAYFVLCAALYVAVTPERRWLARDPRLWAALGLGLALILPNLVWNASNSFATFSHTADNARWSGTLFRPSKALEFLAAQAGVFGPILAAVLALAAARWRRLDERDRMLLAFALPVIAIVTAQAFISRAHANWAAPAYVSATVLAVAILLRDFDWRWLRASFALHLAVLAVLTAGVAFAGSFQLPLAGDPFARTLGWREIGAATRAMLDEARRRGMPYGSVITDERAMTAELLYYMRGEATPVLAWRDGGRPQDHYEMKRPFAAGSPEPVLLVALRGTADPVAARFTGSEALGTRHFSAGRGPARRVDFHRLTGFKGFERR